MGAKTTRFGQNWFPLSVCKKEWIYLDYILNDVINTWGIFSISVVQAGAFNRCGALIEERRLFS